MKPIICVIGTLATVFLASFASFGQASATSASEPQFKVYYPQAARPEPKRVAITSGRIDILTSEHDLDGMYIRNSERPAGEALGDYFNALTEIIDKFFTPPERKASRELTISLVLFSGQLHLVGLAAKPELSADSMGELQKQLGDVLPPDVSRPVKMNYIVTVWGKTKP